MPHGRSPSPGSDTGTRHCSVAAACGQQVPGLRRAPGVPAKEGGTYPARPCAGMTLWFREQTQAPTGPTLGSLLSRAAPSHAQLLPSLSVSPASSPPRLQGKPRREQLPMTPVRPLPGGPALCLPSSSLLKQDTREASRWRAWSRWCSRVPWAPPGVVLLVLLSPVGSSVSFCFVLFLNPLLFSSRG